MRVLVAGEDGLRGRPTAAPRREARGREVFVADDTSRNNRDEEFGASRVREQDGLY